MKHRRGEVLLSRLLLFTLPAIFLTGCVTLWHPSAYQTGKVMNQGAMEIEAHAWIVAPTNASFAVAPFDGLEARISYGVVGDPKVNAWELSLTKRISQTEGGFTSISLAGERLYKDSRRFGTRISSCLALGFYPSSWFGVYFPLKVGWLDAQWGSDQSANCLEFVPGVGFSFEKDGFVFRIAGNLPTPPRVGDADNVPYIGMQIGFRSATPRSSEISPK